MQKHLTRSLTNLLCYLIFPVVALAAMQAHASDVCRPLNDSDKSALAAYVQKKYKVSPGTALSIAEDGFASGTCFRKLQFRSQGSGQAFAATLYLSPDQQFLLPTLFDLSVDPLAEARKKNAEVMSVVAKGDFPSLGPASAPVTIVEFADFQCPFCRQAAAAMKTFLATAEGKNVRFVFRHFPLAFHPWAQRAAKSTACVGFQSSDHFWELHDWIFQNQQSLTAENAAARINEKVGALSGLDLSTYQNCVENSVATAFVEKDSAAGKALDVRGTPTFFVNGERMVGLRSVDELQTLVRQAQRERCSSGDCKEASTGAAASSALKLDPGKAPR